MSDEVLSVAKLEEIAERVLTFQRYVYRRAWGTYYAVWSAAFVAFVFGGQLPLGLVVPQSLAWIPYAVLYGGVGLLAGVVSAWIFKNARREISLRRATGAHQQRPGRRYALIWLWWLGFYVAAFVSFTIFPREALSVLYAMLVSVEFFVYYSLRFSFPEGIPFEGRLALASYGACIAFSFVASLFTQQFPLLGVAWGLTTVVWLFCAFYALEHAPEELVELRY